MKIRRCLLVGLEGKKKRYSEPGLSCSINNYFRQKLITYNIIVYVVIEYYYFLKELNQSSAPRYVAAPIPARPRVLVCSPSCGSMDSLLKVMDEHKSNNY